jgi:hypothetical protein
MLISDKYKIIFIHIPKNAGTYITTLLYNLDNYLQRIEYDNSGHITAKKCIEIIGEKKFREYTVFAVVRNIYDKMYSLYNFSKNNAICIDYPYVSKLTFNEYLETYINVDISNDFILNWPYISGDNGELLVKNIICFENLIPDLQLFFNSINIDTTNYLPSDKINQYGEGIYIDKYDPQAIEMVRNIARKDLEHFIFDPIIRTNVVNFKITS